MTRAKGRRLPVFAPAARAAFECTACGVCCWSWTVPVDRATYEKLGALLAGPGHPKRFEMAACTTPREHPTDLDAAILNREGGHCVFLDDDNLCYLHKHFGAESKPIACRSFPSKAATTSPAGRFLFPSFGCRGMVESLGRTAGQLDLVRDPAGAEWVAGQTTAKVGERDFVAFDAARQAGVTAGGFDELMVALRRLFALDAPSGEARALAARVWLEDLARGRAWLEASQVRASFDAVISDGGAALRDVVGALPADAAMHMRLLQAILNRRLGMGFVKPDALVWFRDVSLRCRFADATVEESAALFAADLDAAWRPARTALAPIVTSYLADKLFYNSEFFRVGVIPGFHAVLCLFAIARLFASARAAAAGAPVDEKTLLAAIETVERQFSHATSLFDFWKDGESPATARLGFAATLALANQ